VFPIRVVAELDTPEGDTFPAPARVGRRFGLSNMALIHGFREIDRTVAEKLDALFPATPTLAIGTRYLLRPPPAPTAGALPFAVDPDLVDRALAAHHSTVDRLARWVASRGFDPRLPTATEPQYDLARFEGDVLNVAEVKSVTKENEEQQLRLGLGQVLRYRELLGSRPCPLEWCNS
jgi:hypothetical protein